MSRPLFDRALQTAPGGVHSPVRSFKGLGIPPVFFERAQGASMYSVEGVEYLDFCMSFGPLILGHRDAEVESAVREMIGKAWTFGACEPYSLALAEWMQAQIPWLEKLRFVSSGTEAVMSALRVARAATGKSKILKFEGCYHGHVDALLVKAGSGLAGAAASSSAGVPEDVAAHTLVAKLGDEAEVRKIFAEHRDIAAVIIEPLPANFGLLPQRPEFLQFLRQITKQEGTLLILDEVISGFRVGLQGMAGVLGIVPDLVCYGKILGGGFPVGCYGGRRDAMDLVAPLGPVYQAGTLSANPVGMVAGLTTLKKMTKLNGWTVLEKRTRSFASDLQKIFMEADLPLSVSAAHSLFWIHKTTAAAPERIDQIAADQAERFNKLFISCLKQGIYLAPNAYEVGFLSMAHDESILNQALTKFKKAVGNA